MLAFGCALLHNTECVMNQQSKAIGKVQSNSFQVLMESAKHEEMGKKSNSSYKCLQGQDAPRTSYILIYSI